MNKIKVTHVGSLPREQDVVDLIFARENNERTIFAVDVVYRQLRPVDVHHFVRCRGRRISDI